MLYFLFMKQELDHQSREIAKFYLVFLKWLLVAALIGAASGLTGFAFRTAVEAVTGLRGRTPWLLFFLPLGGILIVFLYRITGTEGKDTNNIIDSIHSGTRVPMLLVPVIFVSTALTHLLGGSAGREGAALQIGGGIGDFIGKKLGLDEKEQRIAVLAGMSGLFSALFGTPITAAVFALEVCSVGILHYSGLVPCVISSLSAYGITLFLGIPPEHYVIPVPALSVPGALRVIGLAAACALISVVFCETMHLTRRGFARFESPYGRVIFGSAMLVVLTFMVGDQTYNGGGMDVIMRALSGEEVPSWGFLIKLAFTAVTLGCGFKGGEIVPTFFIGATLGAAFGPLLGLPAGFAAAVGLTATFCGAVNCPLASMILSVELFSTAGFIYFALACVIAYLLSGYSGLYEEQRIVYSKLKAEYINKQAE